MSNGFGFVLDVAGDTLDTCQYISKLLTVCRYAWWLWKAINGVLARILECNLNVWEGGWFQIRGRTCWMMAKVGSAGDNFLGVHEIKISEEKLLNEDDFGLWNEQKMARLAM